MAKAKDFTVLFARRERARKAAEKRREERKAAGLCVICGENPALLEFTECSGCRVKRKEANERDREIHRMPRRA